MAKARMVSGWVGKVRYRSLLQVVTHDDRFVVLVAGVDKLTVPAADITSLVRETGFAENWPSLRIEHTAPEVPAPIVLFLKPGDPVRRDIEQLRPKLVTSAPETWSLGPRAFRLVFGLGVVALTMAAGIVEGQVMTFLPFALFGLLIAAANFSTRWR